MSTWHADEALLARYVEAELDDARASSIESHLMGCEGCREAVATIVPPQRLDRIWAGVVDTLDTPRRGVVERALVRLRVPDHVARLLAATPSLRLSWLAAEVFVLVFAVITANTASGPNEELALFVFLVIGALLPVAGIAVAFGPGMDPTYEIGVAAPIRADRLLLLRAAAVLVTSIAITGCGAALLPALDAGIAAAWLLPSLGLSLAVLALGTRFAPLTSALGVTCTWLVTAAVAAAGAGDRMIAFRSVGQWVSVVVIVASATLLVRRRFAYERIAR
ncbi:MAG: zf-HC2 domain-containing protein [Actinomycetota bacterium]